MGEKIKIIVAGINVVNCISESKVAESKVATSWNEKISIMLVERRTIGTLCASLQKRMEIRQ